MRLARENGARTALDIDYRPNLWGLAGHDAGEERFIASDAVTARLQAHLGLFDLIVGTEEEFHIAGGSTDTIAALRAVRGLCQATLVCKRGPMGAAAFTGDIPDSLDDGISGPGFPIEVYNVLGAGDGFMAGLLKGWLTDEGWEQALTYANACGAIAVSRHGCAPAYPSKGELAWFLTQGSPYAALRHDRLMEHIHWATNRRKEWPALRAFAFDHRSQMEDMAAEAGAVTASIPAFKRLCLDAVLTVADGRDGYGLLCDSRLGAGALHAAAGTGLWIGRPVEIPGSRPLALEIGPDLGTDLAEWPIEHVVKVLCFAHPDDSEELWHDQIATVTRLADAAQSNNLEFLLELIPSKAGPVDDETTATVMRHFYKAGVRPDWWKLEPMQSPAAWQAAGAVIDDYDPWCQGIVILGLGADENQLAASFAVAAGHHWVKGFAVGRTIYADVFTRWLNNEMDDAAAVAEMARRYARMCTLWDTAHIGKPA